MSHNFYQGLTHDGHTPLAAVNIVGNYYKRGPSSEKIHPYAFHKAGRYFLSGNFVDGFGDFDHPWELGTQGPRWLKTNNLGERLSQPAPVASVATHSAREAYNMVLSKAGCFPRDRVTGRTIREATDGTGEWARNAPAAPGDEWFLERLPRGKAPLDTDLDGIPDDWEDAHGLNKRDGADDINVMASGYTAIEEYANERAELLLHDGVGNK